MSTSLKKLVGMLVTAMALSVMALLVLPGMAAEAQEDDAPAEPAAEDVQQSTNQDTNATTTMMSRPAAASEEPVVRLVVPGDSLWSIAQERLGPEASPQQTASEVERIYELNRELIGEDPNLILPGQELLVAQGTEPVADTSAPEFTTTTTAQEEPATAKQPQPKDEPAQEQINGWAYSRLTLLLSFGLFVFTLAVAVLGVWKLLGMRRLRREHYERYYGTYDRLRYPEEREANVPTADAAPAPESTAEDSQTSKRE